MPTFLFDKIVFGPVHSRRLGVSLGINLLPTDSKVCSFDCIYCECGLNPDKRTTKAILPSRSEVYQALEDKLRTMQQTGLLPDVITYAGNGEPTLHPDFSDIIDDSIQLRNQYCHKARIAVLSNASRIQNESVFNALLKIEDNILKLDSGLESTIQQLDQPNYKFNLPELVESLYRFKGQLIIQTLFVRGTLNGQMIDNTSEEDLTSWLNLLKTIKPQRVMIYTIERDTPYQSLKKVPLEKLKAIAQRVEDIGLETMVSG
jgi:wyosine [tRNA(Phe)-imidazoG37] synthetase (radical SAM superfamily)